MLDIINVQKTFNPGTVNEKKALCGINLHLDEGDFVTVLVTEALDYDLIGECVYRNPIKRV